MWVLFLCLFLFFFLWYWACPIVRAPYLRTIVSVVPECVLIVTAHYGLSCGLYILLPLWIALILLGTLSPLCIFCEPTFFLWYLFFVGFFVLFFLSQK